MTKGQPIKVLIIEDSDDAALLTTRELKRAAYEPAFERVETEEEMLAALEEQSWDIIICDHRLPQFSSLAALRIYRKLGLDIPFIVVSGAISEEDAVQTMKAGAHDYVMKNNLSRLVPAIERELKEAETRARRRNAEEQIHASHRQLLDILEFLPDATFVVDKDRKIIAWNMAIEELTGAKKEEMLGKGDYEYAIPFYGTRTPMLVDLVFEPVIEAHTKYNAVERRGRTVYGEGFIPVMGGERGAYFWGIASPLFDGRGEVIGAIESVRDVTDKKTTEEALRKSEEKYRSIVENAIEGIFQATPEGQFISVNPALARMGGFESPEEMIASLTDISRQLYVHQEDRERYRRIIVEKGVVKNFEAQVYRKDGSIIWTSTNSRAVKDATGRITHFEGTTEDITPRKRAEEVLLKSETKYKTLFENANDAIFLVKDNMFVDCNTRTLEIFRCTREQILGQLPYRFSPPLQAGGKDSKEEALEKMGAALADNPQFFEWQHIRYDGTPFYANVSLNAIKLDDEPFIQAIVRDITDRKRAEEALKRSEEKYRSIFENAMVGIFQTTPDGRLLSANPALARIHGFSSPEEMMKAVKNVTEDLYVNPGDRQRHIELLKNHCTEVHFETQLYRHNKETIWVEMDIKAYRDEDGQVLYYEGIVEDITSRKLAEESLKQTTDRLRRGLVGTIQTISLISETRDPYTAGHQRSVSRLARTIAQEMGLSKDAIDNIRMAGSIHDIGKMSVPAEILSKPTKLNDIEMGLIKVHPQTGYEILKDAELPSPIAEIVLQHHERLDGSGYPQGLKGDRILLEARIVSVADVVEAIASHRPYRPAFGIEAALEEIEENKDILYDARVVEVCLKLFREKGLKVE
jgi:PAS domain S-box-containing protein